MERYRQSISVIVALVGVQDTSVAVHHAGTKEAAVGVRVGGALVYLRDAGAVDAVAGVWGQIREKVALLPRKTPRSTIMLAAERQGPAVLCDVAKGTPTFASLERPAGRDKLIRVRLGHVVFDLQDRSAFRSTDAAFRTATRVAATVFPPSSAAEEAAAAAARAFAAFQHEASMSRPVIQSRYAPVGHPARPVHERSR